MGWLIIISITLAAFVTYFFYLVITFRRVNYTRCYPEISITGDAGKLKKIG